MILDDLFFSSYKETSINLLGGEKWTVKFSILTSKLLVTLSDKLPFEPPDHLSQVSLIISHQIFQLRSFQSCDLLFKSDHMRLFPQTRNGVMFSTLRTQPNVYIFSTHRFIFWLKNKLEKLGIARTCQFIKADRIFLIFSLCDRRRDVIKFKWCSRRWTLVSCKSRSS
jgi:hypothetical protein